MAITKLIADSITSGAIANTPAFFASLSADQSVSDAVQTKLQADSVEFDTDSAYDNTTNYRFTVPTGKGGKYYVTASIYFESSGGIDRSILYIFKNGSSEALAYFDLATGDFRVTPVVSVILDLSAGDYLEVYGTLDRNSGTSAFIRSAKSSYFGAYKIIE